MHIFTEQMKAELDKTKAALFAVLQDNPVYFRPPYGSFNDEVLSYAQQLGYQVSLASQISSFGLNLILNHFIQLLNQPINQTTNQY